MKILFLTDNFPPEINAPATRTFEHCREWVAAGAEVTVITCAPNFPAGRVFEGYRNRLFQREEVAGIEVLRVWSYIAPNAGFAKRIVDFVSFAASSFVVGLFQDFDLVVATSPQFFTTWAGAALARAKHRPWVFELRDLWPESIVATGAMGASYVIDVLEKIELDLYRDADLVVAVTPAFRRNLAARGIDPEKVAVIPNGVLADAFDDAGGARGPAPGNGRPLRVGYIGTMGLAHGLEIVLDAAALMEGESVEFVLTGAGARRSALEEAARQRDLTAVTFRDPVPREAVPSLLAEMDVALVPLRKSETFLSVIPSKIFEAAAASLPIALGVEGQAQEIVEEHGAGLCFEPENAPALVSVLRRMADDRDLYASLQAGCARLAEAYDRRRLAGTMLEHLRRVAAPTGISTASRELGPGH